MDIPVGMLLRMFLWSRLTVPTVTRVVCGKTVPRFAGELGRTSYTQSITHLVVND